MSNQPGTAPIVASDERVGRILTTAGQSASYITLVVGYLLTILTTPHLALFPFLVFTFSQVGYCALIWGMMRRMYLLQLSEWRIVLLMTLCGLITVGTGLLSLLGLEWDWLLYLVTLGLFFLILSLRAAIVGGILLYIALVVNLGLLSHWQWLGIYGSLLSLLPAFAFVAIFSVVIRFLEVQRDRAEHLLRQLEASNTELEQAHKQLQEYANEVEELTIVRERTRLAREIHDTLGHYLSILSIQLETIGKLQERDPARAVVEVAEARRVAAQSMQEVRNAVAALRPTSIGTLSISAAIAQLGKEFERNAPETVLTLDLDTELPALSPDVQVALYRTAQEAFTNIRKHAQAGKVLVRLRYEDEALELLVLDNGKGPAPKTVKDQSGGFGLIGLRERIELLDGQISFGPAEQGGYSVNIRVPLPSLPQTTSGVHIHKASVAGVANIEGTQAERIVF